MKNNIFDISCEIGARIPRVDAYEKVIGKTIYASDYHSKDMLWLGVKRGGAPHAKILDIDIEQASKVDGVVKIFTYKDVKGTNRQGVAKKDQPVLVDSIIKHYGDPIALVAAKDIASLKDSLDKIVIKVEPLTPIFDVDEALKSNAPLIQRENSETDNKLLGGKIKKGLGAKGFEECDVVVELEINLPMQEHAYIETEAGWAIMGEDGRLNITVSTQTPFRDRFEVSEALGIPLERVNIIAPYCGGAFGGKDGITVQTFLGLAAINLPGKPVKIYNSREESFVSSSKRHPAKVFYKLGAKSDGSLNTLYANIKYDTGCYDHLGGVVMALGLEHAGGAYRIPNTEIESASIYTNNPLGGAFRGFGVTQVNAGLEQIIDMIAEKLKISDIDIRMKNLINKGEKSAIGSTITTSMGFKECLKTISEHYFYKNREEWKDGAAKNFKRGVGIASAIHGIGYGPKVPDIANV